MFISLLCMWRRIRDRRRYGFDLWLKLQFWDVVDPFISFLLPLSPILSFFACSAILPACSLSLLLSTKIDPHILTIYLTQRSSVWYSGINNIMNLLEMWFFFSLTKIGLRGCEALFHHYFWHSFSLRDITIVLILQSDFFWTETHYVCIKILSEQVLSAWHPSEIRARRRTWHRVMLQKVN